MVGSQSLQSLRGEPASSSVTVSCSISRTASSGTPLASRAIEPWTMPTRRLAFRVAWRSRPGAEDDLQAEGRGQRGKRGDARSRFLPREDAVHGGKGQSGTPCRLGLRHPETLPASVQTREQSRDVHGGRLPRNSVMDGMKRTAAREGPPGIKKGRPARQDAPSRANRALTPPSLPPPEPSSCTARSPTASSAQLPIDDTNAATSSFSRASWVTSMYSMWPAS
jgi:hypothetical protein